MELETLALELAVLLALAVEDTELETDADELLVPDAVTEPVLLLEAEDEMLEVADPEELALTLLVPLSLADTVPVALALEEPLAEPLGDPEPVAEPEGVPAGVALTGEALGDAPSKPTCMSRPHAAGVPSVPV